MSRFFSAVPGDRAVVSKNDPNGDGVVTSVLDIDSVQSCNVCRLNNAGTLVLYGIPNPTQFGLNAQPGGKIVTE